jgi:biotin-(acetyl-CoA carboxylase) ligase
MDNESKSAKALGRRYISQSDAAFADVKVNAVHACLYDAIELCQEHFTQETGSKLAKDVYDKIVELQKHLTMELGFR